MKNKLSDAGQGRPSAERDRDVRGSAGSARATRFMDFSFVRRMVVKVGTSILRKQNASQGRPSAERDRDVRGLAAGQNTGLNTALLKNLAAQIADLRAGSGRAPEIILVSSGAVGSGMMTLGFARRPTDTATLQAAAAVGQPRLMEAWAGAFAAHRLHVSQLLLTNDGLQDRRRFLNAKNAIHKILELGVIPIVNENDTVAVEELTFGDNDKLSALVAAMVDADLLVNLTDVDGFYAADESTGRKLQRIVTEIRPEWLSADATQKKGFTRGGMSAKLRAARIALAAGIPVVIASGIEKNILPRLLGGEAIGTRFLPGTEQLKGKKVWLSFFPVPAGKIVVDAGAIAAILRNGKSLLPSGIISASGHFPKDACVSVVAEDGREIARGITHYSAAEIALIAGGPSAGIRDKLGWSERDEAPPEVIHRDNLAAMG